MSTQTDTPRIVVASFEVRGDKILLRADTEEHVELKFEVDALALAIMSITMAPALQWAKAQMERENPKPQPPAAPDSPEGLEG